MPYKVKLASFEGPLDLLLFLIRQNEVDIYNIPIAAITQQYLEYLEIIQLLDLEAASDFILMAATLMRIKAQFLLPKPVVEEEEGVEDPRQELVYRLLEYRRFKEVAAELGEKEKEAKKIFSRGRFEVEQEGLGDGGLDVTLFDLIAAFKEIFDRQRHTPVHRVYETTVTLEERLEFIRKKLSELSEIRFSELFEARDSKIVWIVTFVALLELIKGRTVTAIQSGPFEEIVLRTNHG